MKYQQESIKPYSNEGAKGEQVERMFDQIAHSYDFLTHTLCLGIDHCYRLFEALRSAAHPRCSHWHRRFRPYGSGPSAAPITHRS